jgi:thioesterase domain-containing protein
MLIASDIGSTEMSSGLEQRDPCELTAGDGLEATLGRLWEEILERGPARPDSRLTEMRLGVRRVHRLLFEIAQATGVELPISVVFEAPTFSELVALVRRGEAPPFSPLALLRAGDSGPALFLAPGLGGVALELCDLAREVRFPGAIYAMQPRGLDGREKPCGTAEEMAKFQLEAIRRLHPHGPYYLGGFSWGAVVALEMARVLRASGEPVAFIGLIEAQLPEKFWPLGARVEFVMRRTRHHIETVRRLGRREKLRYLADRARPIVGRLGAFLGGLIEWSPYQVDDLPVVLHQVRESSIAAYRAYQPQRFLGPATYFKSKNGDPLSCDQLKTWPRFLPNFEIRHVPGDHAGMLREPVVKLLAAEMSSALEASDASRA